MGFDWSNKWRMQRHTKFLVILCGIYTFWFIIIFWILLCTCIIKSMSEYIQSRSLSSYYIGKHLTPLLFVQLFPLPKLIDRWKELAQTLFHKNENILSCNTKQKQKHSDSEKHFSETHIVHHQNVRVSDWQHICFV